MSTKLYDGIILDKVDLWKAVKEIRTILNKTFETLNTQTTTEQLSEAYASYVTDKYYDSTHEFKNGFWWREATQKIQTHEETFFNDPLYCNFQVFEPLEDGRMLAYVFTHNTPEYAEELLKLDYVHEFGYWNNSDKPDEISETEWNERRSLWNKQLDKNFYITGEGVSVKLEESKNRTISSPSEETIDVFNNSSKVDKLKTLSSKLLQKSLAPEIKARIDNTGDLSEVMSILNSTAQIIVNAEVHELPISDVPVFEAKDLLSKSLPLPKIDEEKLDKLHKKVIELAKD